jgi:diguanylate cyclase (GGDEF)-like protein
LVTYINERIRKLKQSGFFEEIYIKYFYTHSDGYVSEQNRRTLFFVLVGVGLILALMTLMQLVIRRLRRNLHASIERTETASAGLARANAELLTNYNEIHTLAFTNAVTGLPNKNAFREAVRRLIEAGQAERFGILYLDLVNFNDVNDTFGHDIGDKVLRAVAATLASCQIPAGSLYNMSADEFAILMTDVPPSRDETRVRAILQAVEKPVYIDGSEFHITASMGIACYPKHGQTYEVLLKNADAAMYHAKANGCSMYVFFDDTIGNAVLERTKLQNSLRQALANNEFRLYYQPQVGAKDNNLYGFEALIRWERPYVGLTAPGTFIKVAEDSRLIVPIGAWVLENACSFVRQVNETFGTRYTVAVNVSVIQLLREDYVESVLRTLRETQLAANLLELEITESCLLVETELVIGKLRQLSDAGVRIALDDFGIGYSSLRYLKDLPVHVIKVDQYFVDSIASKKSRSMVYTIISIGHALGMQLVAEGIETVEQRDAVGELRCDRLQGYLISKPMPEAEVANFVKRNRADTGKG